MSTNDSTGVESTGTTTAASPSESNRTINWDGPFVERNAYGTRTGYTYVQCPDCSIDVLTERRAHAAHREGCQHR
jgi:hypothetical protein